MIKKKLLTTTIALVAALGLAGCSTSATSTNKAAGHEPQAAKVAKANTHKAAKKNANTAKNAKADTTEKAATTNKDNGSSTVTNKAANAQVSADKAMATNKAANGTKANKAVTKTDQEVLNGFMAQSGIKAEEGNQYIVTNQGNGQYQIEIRNSNGDANVSHLSGLYHYNTNTNHVSQMNVTTGQFN